MTEGIFESSILKDVSVFYFSWIGGKGGKNWSENLVRI